MKPQVVFFVATLSVPLSVGTASAEHIDPNTIFWTGGTGAGFAIPDNDPIGASSSIFVWDNSDPTGRDPIISNVYVILYGFEHTYIGDLIVTLGESGFPVPIMRRPGYGNYFSDVMGQYEFSNAGGFDFWEAAGNAMLTEDEVINEFLVYGFSNSDGDQIFNNYWSGNDLLSGPWTLSISDHAAGDTGSITGWDLGIEYTQSGFCDLECQEYHSETVPEPGSWGLIALAGLGVASTRRRR